MEAIAPAPRLFTPTSNAASPRECPEGPVQSYILVDALDRPGATAPDLPICRLTSGRTAPARLIWALGATQIIGYGSLYYSFSILPPDMAPSTAVSPSLTSRSAAPIMGSC